MFLVLIVYKHFTIIQTTPNSKTQCKLLISKITIKYKQYNNLHAEDW